jgi:chemotaxis protein CheZ
MPASDTAKRVRDSIEQLRNANLKDRPLVEVLELSHQLADTMKYFFGSLDQSIQGEFRYIADFIHKARDEIAALRPNEIRNNRIPSAGAELEAITRDTERATETIMSTAEGVLSLDATDPVAYREQVEAAMMTIIESCSFQDLTGQRVSKVVTTLNHIEMRVSQFASALGVSDAASEETDAEKRQRELLLNGPAIGGPETSQDDIDSLLGPDVTPEGELEMANQDDIDALFD